jgi:tRNA-dihydrouridine synthase 1
MAGSTEIGSNFISEALKISPFICPPMVRNSELAFRMQVRRYNINIAYTPMISADAISDEPYSTFKSCPEDRPLIVQLSGNSKDTLCNAAIKLERLCDAIDLNLGCPQKYAERNHIGAFLLDEPDLICDIVSAMSKAVSIPITCKIRILESRIESVKFALKLQESGCKMLTVHGRLRAQRHHQGPVDWDTIRAIKSALTIPVICNGGIDSLSHAVEMMKYTKCNGIMAATHLLYNPALFSSKSRSKVDLAFEYMDLARKFPPLDINSVRDHLLSIFFNELHQIESIQLFGLLRNRKLDQMIQFDAWLALFTNHIGDELPFNSIFRDVSLPSLTDVRRNNLLMEGKR